MEEKTALNQLENELQAYKKALGQAADTIVQKEVSDYPIFVVHHGELDLGIPLIQQEDVAGNWSVNASTLEEFSVKQIVSAEKIASFRQVFKNPKQFLCLFVFFELGANFVFIPRA